MHIKLLTGWDRTCNCHGFRFAYRRIFLSTQSSAQKPACKNVCRDPHREGRKETSPPGGEIKMEAETLWRKSCGTVDEDKRGKMRFPSYKYMAMSYVWSSTQWLSEWRGPKDRRRRRELTSVMWDFVHLRCMLVTRIIRFIFAQCVDSVVETLGASCLQCEKQESQTAFDIYFFFYPTQKRF